MTNQNRQAKDFLIGAAVGGVLGTVTALLTAPKSGKRLRQDLSDVYEDLTDKTNDMACQVGKRSRSWLKNVKGQTADWTERARSMMEEEEEHETRDRFIGGMTGGVLGALAGLLLAPKSGSEFRQDIADTYEDLSDKAQDFAGQVKRRGRKAAKNVSAQANDWIDYAKDIVDYLADKAEDVKEKFVDEEGENQGNRLQNIAELASMGYRVWQEMKKRR